MMCPHCLLNIVIAFIAAIPGVNYVYHLWKGGA